MRSIVVFRSFFSRLQNIENKRWGHFGENGIRVDVNKLGDRPVGTQADDAEIVQTAWAATDIVWTYANIRRSN